MKPIKRSRKRATRVIATLYYCKAADFDELPEGVVAIRDVVKDGVEAVEFEYGPMPRKKKPKDVST